MFEKVERDSIDFESRLQPLTQATLVDRTVLGRRMSPKEEELELLSGGNSINQLLAIKWQF